MCMGRKKGMGTYGVDLGAERHRWLRNYVFCRCLGIILFSYPGVKWDLAG